MRSEVDLGKVDPERVPKIPRAEAPASSAPPAPPLSGPRGRRPTREAVPSRAWRALMVASMGTVLVGFNSTASNLAIASIQGSFLGASAADVGWGIAGFMIGTAAFLPLGGRLADRIGRKVIFQTGLALYVLSAVASAVAPTVLLLNVARVVQAIGGAAILPASLSLVLPMFPASRRPSAIGLWSAAGPLAAAIAPALSALFLGTVGWRILYFVSAPVAALMFVVAARLLTEVQPPKPQHRLDLLGAAAGTVGLAAVVTALMQGGRVWGWTSPVTLASLGVGLVALVGFVASSLRHPEPLLNLHLLRRRGVWVTQLANFLVGMSSQPIWLVWPLFMEHMWGFSSWQVGLGLTIGPVVAGTSTVVFSRLGERVNAAALCRLGSGIHILAIGWQVTRLGTEPDFFAEMAPTLAMFGLGWGMCVPLLNSVALAWVPDSYFGEVSGLFNTGRYAAAAIGIAGVFALLKEDSGEGALVYYQHALVFFLVAAVVGFLSLWIPIGRPTPEQR